MRRNNAPRPHRSSGNAAGPLMTDHLKLQDLDLELELLKRKREMIEQQQQILANERQQNNRHRQFGYDQPHSQQNRQYNDNQNFSDYYNEPSFSNLSGSGLLGKRMGRDPEWLPPHKRFSGNGKKKTGAGPNHDPKPGPQPLLDQRISPPMMHRGQFSQQSQINIWDTSRNLMGPKSTPPSRRFNDHQPGKSYNRDFRSRKVVKAKALPSSTVPKLVSYPIPQRKAIVQETSHLVKEVDKNSDFILQANKVPSQQMAGRLELALGFIVKSIKGKYGDTEEFSSYFQSQFLLRQMKHAIRERLRRVMLGKHVGKLDDIVEHYRKVFPMETDPEILQVALEAQKAVDKKQLSITIEEADTTETYYKTNMNKLIATTLDEMFEKLIELYGADCTESIKEEYKDILAEEKTNGKTEDDVMITVESTEKIKEENNIESDKKEEEGTIADDVEQEEKEGAIADDVEQEEKEGTIADDVEQEEKKGTIADDVEQDENKGTMADDVEQKEKEGTVADDVKQKENDDDNDENGEKSNADIEMTNRLKRLDSMMCALLKRRISTFIPKYREYIIKVLDLNKMYKTTKEYIESKLKGKLIIEGRIEESKQAKNKNLVSTPPRNYPYYVKIFGSPALPSRKLMQSFLEQYNPKSIKKHKHLNLLFVSFTAKEDFDKIVAVKESVIGNSIITISISEKLQDPKENLPLAVDNDVQIIENGSKSGEGDVQVVANDNQSKDLLNDAFTSDLDDQINDLLCSIRKEQEKVLDNENEQVPEEKENTNEAANEEVVVKVENIDNDETVVEDELKNNKTNDEEVVAKTDSENNKETDPDDTDNMKVKEESVNTDTDDTVNTKEKEESKDTVTALKGDVQETGRATPTRSSSRLANATPSSIRTRRSSKLAQN